MRFLLLALAFFLAKPPALAAEPPARPTWQELVPTQITKPEREVDLLTEEWLKAGKDDLIEWLKKNVMSRPFPMAQVRDPKTKAVTYYLLGRHEEALALHRLLYDPPFTHPMFRDLENYQKKMRAEVALTNPGGEITASTRQEMEKLVGSRPGQAGLPLEKLPHSLAAVPDDPYLSLAHLSLRRSEIPREVFPEFFPRLFAEELRQRMKGSEAEGLVHEGVGDASEEVRAWLKDDASLRDFLKKNAQPEKKQALARALAKHSAQLTTETQNAARAFGNRGRYSLGPVINPPKGSFDPQLKRVQEKLQRMVEDLGGRDLEGYAIHLNIYESTLPQAFMSGDLAQYVRSKPAREENRRLLHRKFLGYTRSQPPKPLYEIGVSTRILSLFESEDELAFLLAHEINHLTEGHSKPSADPMDGVMKIWGSQQHEGVADNIAIERMLGKYDLAAGPDALRKVYGAVSALPGSEGDTGDAIQAAKSSHHDIGVRFSLLEGEIERLRRLSTAAAPRERKPLGPDFRLPYRDRTKDLEFDKHRRWLAEETKRLLDGGQFRYVENDFFLKPKNEKLYPAYSSMKDAPYSRDQGAQLVRDVVNAALEKPGAPAERVNTFLKMLSFLNLSGFSFAKNDPLDLLQPEERHRISRFLLENSGPGEWTPASFFEAMKKASPSAEVYSNADTIFIFPGSFQEMVKKLVGINSNWAKLPGHFTDFARSVPKDEIVFHLIGEGGRLAMDKDHTPGFKKERKEGLRQALGQVDASLYRGDKGVKILETAALVLQQTRNNVGHTYDQDFVREVEKGLSGVFDRYFQLAVKDSLNELGRANIDLARRVELLKRISVARGYLPERAEADDQIRKAIIEGAEAVIKEGTVLSENFLTPYGGNQPFMERHLASVLADPAYTAEQKVNILDLLLLGNYAPSVSADEISIYLRSLSPVEARRLLTRLEVPVVDQAMAVNNGRALEETLNKKKLAQERLFEMIGSDPELNGHFLKGIRYSDLEEIVSNRDRVYQQARRLARSRKVDPPFRPTVYGNEARMWMDAFVHVEGQAKDFSSWNSLYRKIANKSRTDVLQLKSSYREALAKPFRERWLPTMEVEQIYEALAEPQLRNLLEAEEVADHLASYLKLKLPPPQKQSDIVRRLRAIEKRYSMVPSAPELHALFRDRALQALNGQPADVPRWFPDLSQQMSKTERTKGAAGLIRVLSGFTAESRGKPLDERIQLIEHLLGRRDDPPAFALAFEEAGMQRNANTSLALARARLAAATAPERTIVTNSFLAGPGGLAETDEGVEALLEHLLKSVPAENQPMAKLMGKAFVSANRDSRGLALSFLLAQKQKLGAKALSEADLLASLLLAHGVPGIKLGQYLAFTPGFQKYAEAFADFQDEANPLSYDQILDLLNERYQGDWPKHLKVKGALGSGSVNVAVEVLNELTGEDEVISILRPSIETETAESFRKFNLLLQELRKHSTDKMNFDFVLGLSKIVEKSVELEFDKKAAFDMQVAVFDRYVGEIDGWKIESVPASRVENKGIFMKKANGITAKKLLKQDPGLYQSAMKAFSQVEMDILLGMGPDGSPRPVPLHANPDIHDGQLIIDLPNRRVQLLDFGQAVEITNAERNEAIDLLRVITKAESPEKSTEILNRISQRISGRDAFTREEVAKLLASTDDRMDLFIKLVSESGLKGLDIPLPAVHWVLAANRQIELGKKIGVDNMAAFRNLILARKTGLPLGGYNRARLTYRKLPGMVQSAIDSCSALFGLFSQK